MARAFEITVWKPHVGMRAEFMKDWKELTVMFKAYGVSEILMLDGHAGKDVGNVVTIQTFKGLADNGILNEAIVNSQEMKDWLKEHNFEDYAEIISHDLYVETE